jgi:hypothetical protein
VFATFAIANSEAQQSKTTCINYDLLVFLVAEDKTLHTNIP